jgi:hypothetical protein
MKTNDPLDLLLQQASAKTPDGSEQAIWQNILHELQTPAEPKIPFRQLRNAGIAAVILIACNIWMCSKGTRDGRQEPQHSISYDLNIY